MAKLFLFGIGGTGSRVIKSLTMLLASGVDMGNNVSEIVPIIVDTDKGNEDLTRTIKLLKSYNEINQKIATHSNYKGFFQTKISNLYPTSGKEHRLMFPDVDGKSFGRYIDSQTLRGENKEFVDLLFSGNFLDNGELKPLLEMDMSIGFQGNPKLGCVVLDQFKGNNDLNTFAQNFDAAQGDRIMIISSIYGGTGAAGFPLLLKNIRSAQPPIPNSALLQNATVGAISVLPYFDLEDGDIKSGDFISKTKAALQYYENNVNPQLNSMYYIGSTTKDSYKNNKGGANQKNNAHFVEVAAAMAIVDFAQQPLGSITGLGTRFLEYGVNSYSNVIDFSILGNASKAIIEDPLIKYHFFKRYLKEELKKSIDRRPPWTDRTAPKITNQFISTTNGGFFQTLNEFNLGFDDWQNELENNKPQFKPFNNQVAVFDSIQGRPRRRSKLPFRITSDFNSFTEYLNVTERTLSILPIEVKFIELFNKATSKILTDKF